MILSTTVASDCFNDVSVCQNKHFLILRIVRVFIPALGKVNRTCERGLKSVLGATELIFYARQIASP